MPATLARQQETKQVDNIARHNTQQALQGARGGGGGGGATPVALIWTFMGPGGWGGGK